MKYAILTGGTRELGLGIMHCLALLRAAGNVTGQVVAIGGGISLTVRDCAKPDSATVCCPNLATI